MKRYGPNCSAIFVALCLLAPAAHATKYVNDEPVCEIAPGQDVVDQGLGEELSARWWFTGQGSQLIPYDWFLYLEQADSRELFRQPDNIRRYGYFYAPEGGDFVREINPDGLPVGFARSVDPKDQQSWFGPTCSACHSNEITYQGRRMIIDGGPSQADFWQFVLDITEALVVTLEDDRKFADFAGQLGSDSPQALRLQMQKVAQRRVAFNERNAHRQRIRYGHGRVDAFGVIFNQVTSAAMQAPQNTRVPDAPVSYPFVWGTTQADRVQWNGVGDNTLSFVGPIARNFGEVMGVFGRVDIDPATKKVDTSALYHETRVLEDVMEVLPPPRWPSSFPPIDEAMCRKGAEVFKTHCHRCHGFLRKENEFEHYRSTMVPLWEVGTDHKTAVNAYGKVSTAMFEGEPWLGSGPPLGPEANAFAVVGQVVIGSLDKYLYDIAANMLMPENMVGFLEHARDRGLLLSLPGLHYKARPLNGIWATAPYLHNGSVPNLRQMLWIEERQKRFTVGCTEFDPEVVGFVQTCENASILDTSVPGNTNVGHLKTQQLGEEQRRALLEFLKSL
ncbi:MAG: di-heme-cytochrome C peroxidase [Halieaceae bacterium]|jgi:mono/diheme cytochrome c family protein|nr:di-heme-cytochrome C peroxidase [Halieaceae bacterium]